MRTPRIIPFMVLFCSCAVAAEIDDNAHLAESARTLNSHARETVGIGIQEIALLLQAGPREFFRKETLEKNGSWVLLKELESKGFVTVRESAMPNGSMVGSTAVSFSATPKGQAVIAALQGK